MPLINPSISSRFHHPFINYSLIEKIAIVGICGFPIFHLSLKGWTGSWMVLGALFCLLAILKTKGIIGSVFSDTRSRWMVVSFLAYPMATLLSQICRESFTYKAYLDISPFFYFIPIIIFIIWRGFDFGRWFQYVLPLMILSALFSCFFIKPEIAISQWGPERLTPFFMDPLIFGQVILTLGILCLSAMDFKVWDFKTVLLKIWLLIGFMIGVYLSVRSGSRTGWLALPICLFLVLIVKSGWSFKKSVPLAILLTLLITYGIHTLSPYAQSRINLAVHEVISYPWNGGIAPDASVGLRITFQRLGWFYFSQSPVYGWGNLGFTSIKDAPEVLNFSTQFARDFAYTALFHNEVMTQIVRYGVLGFTGYCLAVFTPLIIACKHINSNNPRVARCSLFAIIFIICQIVSGLTNEFLNLKAMVAFYAFMISIFIGTIISLTRKPESSTPQT